MSYPTNPTEVARGGTGAESPPTATTIFGPLTSEQTQRWAESIAKCEDEFPQNLPPSDRERLVKEVRNLLRERLITLIARAIARDIMGRDQNEQESRHD